MKGKFAVHLYLTKNKKERSNKGAFVLRAWYDSQEMLCRKVHPFIILS